MANDVMEWVEAWVNDHVRMARYEPSDDDARAQEMAAWLRRDAAEGGITGTDIDTAIAGSIGAGHGLVTYVADAMTTVTNAAISEDF
jgi:hypothetical protein